MRIGGRKQTRRRSPATSGCCKEHERIVARSYAAAMLIVSFFISTGCTIGLLERATAFPIRQQSYHPRPAGFCSTTSASATKSSPLLLDREANRSSYCATKRRTSLAALPASAVVVISSTAKRFRVASVALVLVGLLLATVQRRFRHRVLYPGLPTSDLPGRLGCPFVGILGDIGHDSEFGAGTIYRKTAERVAKFFGGKVPGVFRYYFLGSAYAVVSGGKTFQKLMTMEFDAMTSNGVEMMEGGLFPMKGLLFEQSKKKHSYLRKLVGSALTPDTVANAAPTLQSSAEEQLAKMLREANTNNGSGNSIMFQQVCTDYTVDVARRQILGLDLASEEISVFNKHVAAWARDLASNRVFLGIAVKATEGYKGREWITQKIEQRIDELLEKGDDGRSSTSTLSRMVFATDEAGNRLTREEVMGNALSLIIAGSETSASTLTNALLFLGLHPSVWNELRREQHRIQNDHGSVLDATTLDATVAPYLDAVLKETLRMRTVWALIPRKTLKDIDIDGTIISKGHMIDASPLLTHQEDPSTKLPNKMHLDAIQGFRPDRWLVKNTKNDTGGYPTPDPDWHVPFGFGPRYCLGKHLALLEMKIFLAATLRAISFPKLLALPAEYEYSPNKKSPGESGYFSVKWSTNGSLIPYPADGVQAAVTPVAAEEKETVSAPSVDATKNENDCESYSRR